MSVLGQYLPKSDVCVTSVQPSFGPSGPFELVEALNGVIATIGGETPFSVKDRFDGASQTCKKMS
jgi:hypothetical protein